MNDEYPIASRMMKNLNSILDYEVAPSAIQQTYHPGEFIPADSELLIHGFLAGDLIRASMEIATTEILKNISNRECQPTFFKEGDMLFATAQIGARSMLIVITAAEIKFLLEETFRSGRSGTSVLTFAVSSAGLIVNEIHEPVLTVYRTIGSEGLYALLERIGLTKSDSHVTDDFKNKLACRKFYLSPTAANLAALASATQATGLISKRPKEKYELLLRVLFPFLLASLKVMPNEPSPTLEEFRGQVANLTRELSQRICFD